MDSSMQHWFEILKYCCVGACFGLLGGVTRVVRKGVRGWIDLLSQVFVSAFCGFLAFAFLEGQVDDLMLCGVAGIAGNSGGMLLDAIRFRFMKQVRGK